MEKSNAVFNINGGIMQIMPNVEECVQYIHTKDGTTVIKNVYVPTGQRRDEKNQK